MKKNILVIGTGTIGSPLIGFLADFRDQLDIDVYFHKHTPLRHEVARVNNFTKRGAKLVTDTTTINAFEALGHKVYDNKVNAISQSDVVIDCTPIGNKNKELYVKNSKATTFIAQGSEKGFGVAYAHGINDSVLKQNHKFIQVVSCNTHNIACILKTIPLSLSKIIDSDFVCIRRANDISQESGFVSSPVISVHNDELYGTHHARDVHDLFKTVNKHISVYSSALKQNTQYMHTIRFKLVLDEKDLSVAHIINRIRENKFAALTQKHDSARVFSFGRDHGYYGRILNQAVFIEDSISVLNINDCTIVNGFCFTPQDGNSIISSLAATIHTLSENNMTKQMKLFDEFLFNEI